jgi:hypothetical protein
VRVAQALTNLAQLTGSGDLIALTIEAAGAIDATAPAEPITPIEPVKPMKPIESVARSMPATKPQPAADTPPRPIERPASTVTASPVLAPKSSQPKDEPDREPLSATVKAWLGALFQGARRGAGSVGTAGQMVVQRTLPEHAITRDRASTAARGSAAARGKRQSAGQALNAPLLAGIAISIPIIVSLAVATIFIQGNTKAELAARLADAANAITLANQRSGADARVQWQTAINKASEALTLDPGNTTATGQIAQAQQAIDRLDNVVRVKPVELWDFKSIGQHRLAMQGFSLFVLDRGTNEIDRITLNAAGDALEGNGPEKVLSANTVIDSRPGGNLLDMTWVNSSENRSTNSLIVAVEGGLIEYNLAFGWKTLDFGANKFPIGLRRLRSFNGNLYVLDPAANQVWRYAPKGDGYPTTPEPYFEQATPIVGKAVDLVIDGSIYIVTGDGQIAKYLGGQPDTFQVADVPVPLKQLLAAAVDVNQTSSSLYLAVPGGLVQLRPDGKFVRQFRATGDAFDAIEDMLVDEQNGRVFVISRGVLYTAVLPPIQ